MRRSSKPAIGKFVSWWWLSALFGMWWKRLFHVSVIQFLSVHVRMRSHRASFDRSIDTQRQVPRIKSILALHEGKCVSQQRGNQVFLLLMPQQKKSQDNRVFLLNKTKKALFHVDLHEDRTVLWEASKKVPNYKLLASQSQGKLIHQLPPILTVLK